MIISDTWLSVNVEFIFICFILSHALLCILLKVSSIISAHKLFSVLSMVLTSIFAYCLVIISQIRYSVTLGSHQVVHNI